MVHQPGRLLVRHVLLAVEEGQMCARRIEYPLHLYDVIQHPIGMQKKDFDKLCETGLPTSGVTADPPAQLSPKARAELKDILIREVGVKSVTALSDEEIDHFGYFLLTVFSEALKLREQYAINSL